MTEAVTQQDTPDRQHGEVEIREGDLGDGEAFCAFLDAELRRDYFIPRRQQAEILEGRYHIVWLALEEGHILGMAIVSKAKMTLCNLLVAAAARNRGIGDALLRKSAVSRVRAKLDVSAGDPRDFYRKRGFIGTGEFNPKGNVELLLAVAKPPGRHGRRPESGQDAEASSVAKPAAGSQRHPAGEVARRPKAKASLQGGLSRRPSRRA